MFLSLWPNYWDDWLLEHKISFSGPEKIIYIHPDITDISVKIDLYSAWKEWFLLRDNSKYESAMRVVGGDPISDTRSLGSTYFLTNGWRLKPVQGEYRISIEGNLYTDEGDNQMINADQPSSVNVQFIVSNLVESTISKLTQVEISAFSEALWDEPLNSSTHNIDGTAGRMMRTVAGSIIRNNYAQGSGVGTNQIQLDVDASSLNGAYDPAQISIINGAGAGQTRLIYQYSGSTKIATVDRDWKVLPDTTSEFIIFGNPGREHVNEGLARGGSVNTITLNANAADSDDTYNRQTIFIRAGTGGDQVKVVIDYDGITKIATVNTPWNIIPDSTSSYVMLPSCCISEEVITEAVWGADYLSHTLSGTYGKLIYDLKTDVESISIKLPAGNLAESGEYTSVLNNIELYVLRSLGLSQENYYLDNTIYTDYQGMKLLTSGRIRIYSNSSSVGTDSNVLSTYQIISSWTGNSLTSYKVVKL